MAFPADCTYLGDLAWPSVTGSHANLPAYIKYDDFTPEMLSALADGGGTLRFSDDPAGTTRIPLQVLVFDKVGSLIVVFTKGALAATGEKIHVWTETVETTQPPVTDPFGRNAVWSDYLAVYHLNDLVDSTGNNADLTGTASSSTTTKLGAGSYFFDGTEFLEETGIGYSSGDLVVQTWSRHTNLSADNNTLVSVGDDLQEYAWILYRDDPDADAFGLYSRGSGDSDFFNSASSISTNTWYKNTTVFDISNEIEIYQDGVSLGSASLGGSASMSTPELNIGARLGSSNFMIGQIEGVRIILTVPSANRELTEYQNQDATGAYFIATNAGGVSATVTETLNSFEENSLLDIQYNVSAIVTESLQSFLDSSIVDIQGGQLVEINVTETLNSYEDNSILNVGGSISAVVTETLGQFTDFINANIDTNVSVTVTESLNSYLESSSVNISKDISVMVTETLNAYTDNSSVKLPANWVIKAPVDTAWDEQNKTTTIWTIKG